MVCLMVGNVSTGSTLLENDTLPRVKDTDRDRLSNYQEYLGLMAKRPSFMELF